MGMVNIFFLFDVLVLMFALIGAMRGWARELLVVFSIILALSAIELLENFAFKSSSNMTAKNLFYIRSSVVVVLAFFGYQPAMLHRFVSGEKLARVRVQDTIMGFLVGAFNGVLIVGSLWYYMHEAGYPFTNFITAPTGDTLIRITTMMNFMPPHLFGYPGIFIALVAAFLFVLVVFI